MDYREILKAVKYIADGRTPKDLDKTLRTIATQLKYKYNIEPVDIVSAIYLFDNGRSNYAIYVMKRAYKDLVKIGMERGYIHLSWPQTKTKKSKKVWIQKEDDIYGSI